MDKEIIYDRKEFCEKIINLIENSEGTNAFVLYSEPGVGKSSVYKKIEALINYTNSKKVIRVISPQENKNIQEGAYLRLIFKNINKFYTKNLKLSKKHANNYKKYTFIAYLRKKKKFSAIMQCINNNMDNLITNHNNKLLLLFYGIKGLIDYILLMLGIADNIDIDAIQDNRLISDYIKYVLQSNHIILNIDNVQNFDDLSLDYFMDCLMETKEQDNFILLEFTLLENECNKKTLEKLKKEFKNASISIKSLELENLDIKHVLKIAHNYCSEKDEIFDSTIKIKYKTQYNGNIKKVEHFASIYSKNISLDTDPTFEKMRNLPSKYQYILAIIILNNSVIKYDILKFILENSNNDFLINYEYDIHKFCNETDFIEQNGEEIKIVHSSTIDVWKQNIQIFKKYELNAYRNCQKVYTRILKNNLFYTISKEECLLSLFQLYGKYDVSKLSDFLLQVDEIIYQFLSITELRVYLEKLIESINDSEDAVMFLYKIIEICIKYQLYNVTGFCLQKVHRIIGDNFDEKYNFYNYVRLFQSEEYEDLLNEINTNRMVGTSKEFESYNKLFEIVTNRALNNTKEMWCIINEAEKDEDFKKSIHYAYFLRLAEAYEQRDLAIPKVEKSVFMFQDTKLPLQAAKSQVSLAFLYAITGRINEAKDELSHARKVLQNNIENKYIFDINQACINLLSDDFSEDTWNLLDEAEKCTNMRFDKIAIIINKIILCIEKADYTKGRYLEKKGLELLQTETDKHIHAIFYYNCFRLYKTLHEPKKEKEYYERAYAYKEYCNTLNARLNNESTVKDNTTFLLSKPWHVCFVSYWYFDYLNDL